MTVHQLISELLRSGVDMSAEVLISAPLECNRGGSSAGKLTLPTVRVDAGKFSYLTINREMQGKPWVSICGTDAWGQFRESPDLVKTRTEDLVDSEFVRAEMARLNEMCLRLQGRKKT